MNEANTFQKSKWEKEIILIVVSQNCLEFAMRFQYSQGKTCSFILALYLCHLFDPLDEHSIRGWGKGVFLERYPLNELGDNIVF